MTIWLDEDLVKGLLNTTTDNPKIVDTSESNGRKRITVAYTNSATFNAVEIEELSNIVTALSDGNPEITISVYNENPSITIAADTSVSQ